MVGLEFKCKGLFSSSTCECGCGERTWPARKTWDEVLVNDRKKLGMDSADPQNRSEWRRLVQGRLVKRAQPSVEENRALKWR